MAQAVVQFIGKELGQHGPNIYYKEFSAFSNGTKKSFRLGQFYFVRKNPSQPICIAEFQLIWLNIKDGKKLALVKLYFRPEDTKTGRLSQHGEDELVEADRHVPVFCDQVFLWECIPDIKFGKYAYEGVNATGFITQHKDEEQESCCCHMQNGYTLDQRAPVKVLSFPAYCRYRACMKMFSSGCTLRRDIMAARGALVVECSHTKILFCRFKFQHQNIDDFALAENVRVPVFKGRPRKRKQSQMKNPGNMKKIRIEKENSNPYLNLKNDGWSQSTINLASSQTYKIISSPSSKISDRNVIHMKLESNDLKKPEEEKEYGINMYEMLKKTKLSNEMTKSNHSTALIFEKNGIQEETGCESITKNANVRASSFESNESDRENDTKYNRNLSVKRGNETDEAPSELVKKGKTGTVLDESTFREIRNGVWPKSGEGVDKEKMKKILQDVCKDVDKFKSELYMFMKQRGTPIVYVPKVGYTRVDLPKLFQSVVSNGGYKQVTLNHKWKKIYDEMVLATTITSAATCMRRHYEKLLLPFEKHLRVKHRLDAMPLKTYSVTSQVSQPLVLTIKTIKQDKRLKENGKISTTSAVETATSAVNSQSQSSSSTYYSVNASMADRIGSSENEKAGTFPYLSTCSKSQLISSAVSTSPVMQRSKDTACNLRKTLLPIATDKNSTKALNQTSNVLTRVEMTPNSSIAYQPSISSNLSGSHSAHGSENKSLQMNNSRKVLSSSTDVIKSSSCATSFMNSDVSSNFNKIGLCAQTSISQSSVEPPTHLLKKDDKISIEHNSIAPAGDALLSATADIVHFNSTNQVAKTVTTSPPQTGVSVITKAKPQDKQLLTNPEFSSNKSCLASQSYTPILKKRRGRPPKYLKNSTDKGGSVVSLDSVISHTSSNNCFTVISHTPISSIMQPMTSRKPLTSIATQQKSDDDLSRKTLKVTPVKMYEYIVATDSMQAKLVKHKQGIISLPKSVAVLPTPSNVSAKILPNAVPQDSIAEKNISTTIATNTVTSCSVLYNIPNGLQKCKQEKLLMLDKSLKINNESEGKPSYQSFYDNSDIELNAQHEKQDFDEISEIYSIGSSNGSKDHRKIQSVIVGPPPLVPITKSANKEASTDLKTMDAPYGSDVSLSDAHNTNGNSVLLLEVAKRKSTNGLTQISLMPDYQSMRESLDANSIMKPLSKEIDESLEDLRKAAGANIRQSITVSNDKLYEPSERYEPLERPIYTNSHVNNLMHDDRRFIETQKRYAAYEQLKIDVDPYGYNYNVQSRDLKYGQMHYDKDNDNFVDKMCDNRRALYADHEPIYIKSDDDRHNMFARDQTIHQNDMRCRSHDEIAHCSKSLSNSNNLPVFHRQSSLERCNERCKCSMLHSEQNLRTVRRSNVPYQHFHEQTFHEQYHSNLRDHARVEQTTHATSIVEEKSRLKEPHHCNESLYHNTSSEYRETLNPDDHSRDCLSKNLFLEKQRPSSGRRSNEIDFHHDSHPVSGLSMSYHMPTGIHDVEYHHAMASVFSARDISPSFEHKHLMMSGDSPPPNSVHYSWYHQPHTAPNNSLYWHTKVHH